MKGGCLAPIVAAALVSFSAQAAAVPPAVVLVRPTLDDEVVNEALFRLQGELESNGFAVSIVDATSETDPRRLTESAGRAASSAATIGLFTTSPAGIELWIADRLTGKTIVRRVEIGDAGGRSPAQVLSIRAAELLRASLAETLLAPSEAPAAPAREDPGRPFAAKWVEASLARPRRPLRLGLEAGAGVLGSFDGIGPALVPVLRGRLSTGEYLVWRAGAAGLGTSSKITTPTASAAVRQDVVLVEGQVRFLPGKLVRPTLSIGAGAYGVFVDGSAAWPYEGKSGSHWSPALSAGAGVALRLHSSLELAIEAQALLATSSATVRFFDDEVARAGRPSYFGSLSLVGWQ